MRAETLARAIREAKHFIKMAEAVPVNDFGKNFRGERVKIIEMGKASGAARRASMDLTRALADLRQGR